jgi:hypothetical protein
MINGRITKEDVLASFSVDKPKFKTRFWDSSTGNEGMEYILQNNVFKIVQNDCSWALGTIENDIWYQLYRKVKFLFFFNIWKEIDYHMISDDEFEELFDSVEEN